MGKMKTVTYILALVLTLIIAYFAYDNLSKNMKIDRLSDPSGIIGTEENTRISKNETETSKISETSKNETETTKESVTESKTVEEEVDEEVTKFKIPDFSFEDFDGNSYEISDFFGKPVVINFWATWCPPCVNEMPDFQKVYEDLGEEIQFLMINLTDGSRETKKKALEFINDNKFTFPVFYDMNLEASIGLGIFSYPVSLFLDEEGYLITGAVGSINEELIRKGIDMSR
ncbi:MAG: TlpA family protein disulfide reductase [Clostridiaceae bacterium]|jgi:thiol-disulfide isomerase/thioredoxin|nr:TlpA family protein disulfide reductase [Clostridiaceae bacterium]